MSLVCVPIPVEDVDDALADARQARLLGADLVEFRVDALFAPPQDVEDTEDEQEWAIADTDPEQQFARCARLVEQAPVPCIVTCRSAAEGGEFAGPESERAELIRRLIEADPPPRYIDVEFASLERGVELREAIAPLLDGADAADSSKPRIILSWHDFERRPSDLLRRLDRIRREPAAQVIKLAHRARSLRDNLELFETLRSRDRPTIALAMGRFGLMSRVLAAKFGGFLTFASLREQSATAPGQPSAHDLLNLYRFRSIGSETRVYGVIGWPVEHSRSPNVHNAAFDSVGWDGVYLPMPVPGEWEHFKATVAALTDSPILDFAGASVTMPHKEHLLRFAQQRAEEGWEIEPLSHAAGAANTLGRTETGWRVFNTDAPAFAGALREAMGEDLSEARVGVLGAGGAARSAAAGLIQVGAEVVLYNRTHENAQFAARDLNEYARAHSVRVGAASWEDLGREGCDAYINCTPIGMADGPTPNESPIDIDGVVNSGRAPVIFETVYNPVETPLLKAARARGLTTIDGLSLFVRQAALQFKAWTSAPAPRELMEQVARDGEKS